MGEEKERRLGWLLVVVRQPVRVRAFLPEGIWKRRRSVKSGGEGELDSCAINEAFGREESF